MFQNDGTLEKPCVKDCPFFIPGTVTHNPENVRSPICCLNEIRPEYLECDGPTTRTWFCIETLPIIAPEVEK